MDPSEYSSAEQLGKLIFGSEHFPCNSSSNHTTDNSMDSVENTAFFSNEPPPTSQGASSYSTNDSKLDTGATHPGRDDNSSYLSRSIQDLEKRYEEESYIAEKEDLKRHSTYSKAVPSKVTQEASKIGHHVLRRRYVSKDNLEAPEWYQKSAEQKSRKHGLLG